MKHGRKLIICNVCNKEKLHFGLGMCSACLRNHKRKTKPSFYLGTCYSEISRRCKTFDPLRPNYFRKNKCSKEEFINKFINDEQFLNLYKNWQENDYKRKYAPSIDRIDNNGDYTLENLQFISQSENSKKDCTINIKITINNKELFFTSEKDASLYLNKSIAFVSHLFSRKKKQYCVFYKGYKIERFYV